MKLSELIKTENLKDAVVELDGSKILPPAMTVLRTLARKGLLNDEVFWSLIGQAPIDPIGIFTVCEHWGDWVFNPVTFSMMKILAKDGNTPVCFMAIDLLSNAVIFVGRDGTTMTAYHQLTPDDIVKRVEMAPKELRQKAVVDWFRELIEDTMVKSGVTPV